MNILITGAKGFVGKNLAANLYCIKDGKNRTRDLTIDEIFEYDIDTDDSLLDTYCEKADFVFNLGRGEPAKRPVRVYGWKFWI